MASTYGSLSDGTQSVIDDIADRRRRQHFIKDRRASMERSSASANSDDRQSRYKAWGRTPSGILAESVMTPKEINLIWGWFCPEFKVENKYDSVETQDVMKQLLELEVFEDQKDTISFIQSITKEKYGFINFNNITTSISSYDVSPDHIFSLRQFAKSLKSKKKGKKKRISHYRLEANFPTQEEDVKGTMSKAKSENFVGMFPKPGMGAAEDSAAGLPMIRSSSSKGSISNTKMFAGSNSQLNIATEVTSNVPFSNNPRGYVPSKPTSKVRMRLPLKTQRSDDSLPIISPRTGPDEDSCYSPMNKNTQVLQPMTSSSLTPPPRVKEKAKSARFADLTPMNDSTYSDVTDSTVGIATNTSASNRKSKGVKIAPLATVLTSFVREAKVSSPGSINSTTLSSPASANTSTPPPPLKSCLKTVRKEFRRQLSRMSSSESNLIQDEDAPTKSLGSSINVDFNRNSFRTRKHFERSIIDDKVSKSRTPNSQSAPQEDEDLPTKSLGDTKNIDLMRNSLRSSHQTTRKKQERVESARQLIQRVESASHILEQNDNDQGAKAKTSGRASFTRKKSSEMESKPIVADSDSGKEVLSSLRRTFSRQLSKMSSFSDSPKGSPIPSNRKSSQSPGSSTRRVNGHMITRSEDSMDVDSVASFDSAHELIRFDNPQSANSSFGETIFLRSRSSSELDI